MKKLLLAFLCSLASMSVLAQDAQSPGQLIDLYKTALAKKDLRAYMALVSLTQEKDRANLEEAFRENAQQTLQSAKIVPFSTYEARYNEMVMKRGVRATVDPNGWLVLEWAPIKLPSGASIKNADIMLFGTRNGSYYFGS